MAEINKIIIESGGQGGAVNPTAPAPIAPETAPKKQSIFQNALVISTVQETTRAAYQNTLNQFGDATGNYLLENTTNNMTRVLGWTTPIVTGSGAGPLGIGAGALASGINIGAEYISYSRSERRANISADLIRDLRGGLAKNYRINGART
jgi:hypothetical protein